uniref:Uncharacterized protein n=1 Tax=Lactuca sativa TaxID=4236 RepID=A0A9R1UFX2_LACSA|nr:hypothetical protein LSAT_V11C900466580 [Lactuca sativa]
MSINNGSFTGVHFAGLYPIRCWITKKGSITSIQAVNFPTDDDFTNPTPAITSTHLDATIVLCRRVKGYFGHFFICCMFSSVTLMD